MQPNSSDLEPESDHASQTNNVSDPEIEIIQLDSVTPDSVDISGTAGSGEIQTTFLNIESLASILEKNSLLLEDAIRSTANTPISSITVGALIGAFAAFVFNYINWIIDRRHRRIESLAVGLSNLICDIEDESITYWIQDANQMSEIERKKSEIIIKSKALSIRVQSDNFCDAFFRKKSKRLESFAAVSMKFNDDLYELATGGDFESATRLAEPATASKISNICNAFLGQISKMS